MLNEEVNSLKKYTKQVIIFMVSLLTFVVIHQ